MPNAFATACQIEDRSMEIILPYLEMRGNQWVSTRKGPLAKEMQQKYGDLFIQTLNKEFYALEVKAEERHTGNLFLETFSNGSCYKLGWMHTLRADWLLYHFLDKDVLYIIPFEPLKKWFFLGIGTEKINIQGITKRIEKKYNRSGYQQYPQVQQKKYNQMNDTWGVIVPIDAIVEQIGRLKSINPLGLALASHRL